MGQFVRLFGLGAPLTAMTVLALRRPAAAGPRVRGCPGAGCALHSGRFRLRTNSHEAGPVPVGWRNLTGHDLCSIPVSPRVLATHSPFADGPTDYYPGVWGDRAADDTLAESPGGLDPEGGSGEQHSRDVGVHQALHQDGHRWPVGEAGSMLPLPVLHGTLGPQRGPTPTDRIGYVVWPADVDSGDRFLVGPRRHHEPGRYWQSGCEESGQRWGLPA